MKQRGVSVLAILRYTLMGSTGLILVDLFEQTYEEPRNVYIQGFSLGSIVVAQFLEQSPADYDGGLLGCGPIGDFQAVVDYLADFRVLFDFYFPDVILGDLLSVLLR